VLGGGMAGAIAALSACAAGARVVVVRRAPGATALSSGAVSVAPDLGGIPGEGLATRRGTIEAARRLAVAWPDHPYALVGVDRLGDALAFAASELASVLAPPIERRRFVATLYGSAVGAGLCQRSMVAGDLLAVEGELVVVGFRGHLAFDAPLVAAGLARYRARGGPEVRAVEIDRPALASGAARPHEIARALDARGGAESLGEALREALPSGAGAVLLPPVLGLDAAARAAERAAAYARLPVAETLSDVPSVPGLRLQRALDARLAAAGIALVQGEIGAAPAPGAPVVAGGRAIHARTWILATGRFVGGGVVRRGVLAEPVLRLPVQAAEGREAGVNLAVRPAASLTARDRRRAQPLLSAGLRVDPELRPLDERGRPIHPRLFAAGAVVGGHEQATDGTGLGVAILTGFLAGRAAAVGK
jgi:glycerol-3-phosphate dehydrogenase subunit B